MEKGNKTYYCVTAEFYVNGSAKAAIHSRVCKEMPKNQVGKNPVMTAYKTWFESREQAEAYLTVRKAA